MYVHVTLGIYVHVGVGSYLCRAVMMGSSVKPCLLKKDSALWSAYASNMSYWPAMDGSLHSLRR